MTSGASTLPAAAEEGSRHLTVVGLALLGLVLLDGAALGLLSRRLSGARS